MFDQFYLFGFSTFLMNKQKVTNVFQLVTLRSSLTSPWNSKKLIELLLSAETSSAIYKKCQLIMFKMQNLIGQAWKLEFRIWFEPNEWIGSLLQCQMHNRHQDIDLVRKTLSTLANWRYHEYIMRERFKHAPLPRICLTFLIHKENVRHCFFQSRNHVNYLTSRSITFV